MSYLTSRWRALAVTETHAWALLRAASALVILAASAGAVSAPCARYVSQRRGVAGWHAFLFCPAESDRPTVNADGDMAFSASEGSLAVWSSAAWVSVNGAGGSGAPTGASYLTRVAEAGLSSETALGALTAGLLVNTPTTGAPTIYPGSTCGAGTKATAVDASGGLTCSAVANADVSSGAAIAESKLALAFPTHSAANDPTSGEKAALAGSSGAPGAGNKYVTDADARNANARTPLSHTHPASDIASGALAGARGGLGAAQPTCAAGQFLTCTGTTCSCGTPAGGGSTNVVSVDVDFGTGKADARVTVTGQAWVTASSKIVCVPTLFATTGRVDGTEDALIEGLRAAVYARSAGVGFSVMASVARGFGYGVYNLSCTGA